MVTASGVGYASLIRRMAENSLSVSINYFTTTTSSGAGATPTEHRREVPTIEPEPPVDVVRAARGASKGLARVAGWLSRSRVPLAPVHVFVSQLRPLAEYRKLDDIAKPVSWRFAGPSATTGIAIEVREDDLDVQIEKSTLVEGASRVLKAANNDPRLAAAVFEPRILRVPEAHLTAIWFKAQDAGEDVLVPLDPAPKAFEPFRHYGSAEFLDKAYSLARRTLDLYSAAEDPREVGS